MAVKSYLVNRSMTGDRDYERGDTREMEEAEAADLIESGALSEPGVAPRVRPNGVTHGALEPADGASAAEVVLPPREPSVEIKDRGRQRKKPAAKA